MVAAPSLLTPGTRRARCQEGPVPAPWSTGMGPELMAWGCDDPARVHDSQEQQRPCLRTPSSMVRQKLQ